MKLKFIKKLTIYTLIGSMLFGGVIPALAGKDSIGSVTKTQETDKNENMNTTVYAEVGSFFKVTIPKHIVLDGTEKKGNYTVSAIGDIAGYETLCVTPDKSFALKSNNLNDVTASINQDKTSWKFNEMLEGSNVLGNGLIDAKDITAGSWNGNFNFNIFLDGATTSIKVEAKDENGVNLEASAYDINGSEKEALLNGLVEEGLINSTDEVDALIEVKSNKFEGLADTTFDVSSIAKEGDKVAILHFDETKQEWEYVSTETVDSEGKINADFTSYSPVAFVKVNSDGTYDKVGSEAGLYDANGVMLCTWEESGIGTDCSSAATIIKNSYPTTTKIILSNKVTSIRNAAFRNCTNLTNVTIPSSVNSIEYEAFSGCTNLTEIIIPEGVTSIDMYAFQRCTNLTSVTIPKSLTNIGLDTFNYCTNLTNVTLSEGLTYISNGMFYGCQSLNSITIPNSITNIGRIAFAKCTNLTNVIYKGVTYTNKSEILEALANNGVAFGEAVFDSTGLK